MSVFPKALALIIFSHFSLQSFSWNCFCKGYFSISCGSCLIQKSCPTCLFLHIPIQEVWKDVACFIRFSCYCWWLWDTILNNEMEEKVWDRLTCLNRKVRIRWYYPPLLYEKGSQSNYLTLDTCCFLDNINLVMPFNSMHLFPNDCRAISTRISHLHVKYTITKIKLVSKTLWIYYLLMH